MNPTDWPANEWRPLSALEVLQLITVGWRWVDLGTSAPYMEHAGIVLDYRPGGPSPMPLRAWLRRRPPTPAVKEDLF